MHKKEKTPDMGRSKIALAMLCVFSLCVWAQHTPDTPKVKHLARNAQPGEDSEKKVYLEYAETLDFDEKQSADYQILRGNVRFRKEGMYMFCDSAYFYEQNNSLDAFGNVRMEQGDTLFVYSDVMFYDGVTQIARLRYNVKMENQDMVLFTDSLNYDLVPNIGYFFEGGKLIDSENELTSIYGQYSPDTKRAVFNYDVQLVNPDYILYSDTLEYSTLTKVADILGPSVIVSDSNVIYSRRGWYDTQNNLSTLYDRSIIVSKSQHLTGDTIFYDREKGFGEVFGNMFLDDTLRMVIMEGQYGFYDEKTEYSFATERARALEYSRGDTLYLHADTLKGFTLPDSTRLLQAYYGTRFFRNDMQGVCDSMNYFTRDSALYMYKDPIIWSDSYQIFGDTIKVFMNDSTVDWAHIPQFAFAAQQKDSLFFDQLSGKDLKAYFRDGELYKVDVSGNVQTIFYPQEKDSTYTGLNRAESSFLTMYLKEQQMDKLIMWPEVQGSLTPVPLIKRGQLFLPDYQWFEEYRPTDPDDIFRTVIKPEGDEPKKKKRRFGTQ